jgi:uncharacterized protein (DUF4415 family)
MSKTKNISYGTFETDDSEFHPKNVKVRITTMIDLDVLRSLKEAAKKRNTRYQTLMNEVLRQFITSAQSHAAGRKYRLSKSQLADVAQEVVSIIERRKKIKA